MAGKIRLSKPSVQTKSPALKPAEVKKNWVVFDADGVILGRLAAVIAHRLRGKHRADYTPSVDCGDQVIVINAEKVTMSGHKLTQDKYYYHTGYPGGIKARTRAQILAGRFPERVIEKAVQRMLPEGTLGRKQLGNLKIYAGSEHPHAAQSPVAIEFATANPKNKRVN